MILRHNLSKFTKFVFRDLKYFQDMTRCHNNYDVRLFRLGCVRYLILAPVPNTHFTRSFRCLPVMHPLSFTY